VTFDGIEYEVTKTTIDGISIYGNLGPNSDEPSFLEYPFCIISYPEGEGTVITSNSTAENHNIKIEAKTETLETTEDFRKAVESIIINNNLKIIQGTTS